MTSARMCLVATLLFPMAAGAATFKCVHDGKVIYQDHACPDGKPVDVRPNSASPETSPTIIKQLRETDKRLDARIKDDDTRREANHAEYERLAGRCRRYADEMRRQIPWMNSISGAVRASAWTEYNIQRQHFDDEKCSDVRF